VNPQSRSDSPGLASNGVEVMVFSKDDVLPSGLERTTHDDETGFGRSSVRVPLGAGGTIGAPPEFELPDDLAAFAPTADLPWRVVHEDLRGVTSYEVFLEQLEQPGFGELERVGVSPCD
jgi:hypothetical protein